MPKDWKNGSAACGLAFGSKRRAVWHFDPNAKPQAASFWASVRFGRFPIARRDGDIGQPEHALDPRPFTEIVSFDKMPDPLQHVSADERQRAPVPFVPPHDQENDTRQHHRDAQEMDAAIERMLMPFQPVVQRSPERLALKKPLR